MRRLIRIGLAVAALAGPWLAGCATVPTVVPQTVIDARAALELARKAKADLLVPEEYREAKRLLDLTESSLSAEQAIATVEDLAFQAQSQARIAEARSLTRQMAQEYEAAQKSLTDKQQALLVLAQQANELQRAKEILQQSEIQRKEAEQAAVEAQKIAAAEAARRKELEELLRKAQKIRDAKVALRGSVLVISLSGRVLFNSGSSQLQPGAMSALDQVAQILAEYPSYRIRVEGHTDSTGEVLLNNTLSQARAESVLTYLNQKGVPLDSLTSVGMGSSQPVATNDTAAGRQLNRRVEIMLEKKYLTESEP
ncbi:MAG: OmpA family protein [candidate division FCPU426 bacterium]